MQPVLLFLVALTALTLNGRAAETPAAASGTNTTALLLIDIQNFYFPCGKMPLAEPEAAGRAARRLLDDFRARRQPVIHIQHLPRDQAKPSPDQGDPQYQIHADVRPLPGETVIGKHQASAFRDTDLLATLRRLGVRRLVIAGMQTHMCVEAATRAAADHGFDVIVVHDACATRPLEFNGVTVAARDVHAGALAALRDGYAKVLSTDETLRQLNPH